MELRDRLRALLALDATCAAREARNAFQEFRGDRPVVLFGAGGLGRRILREAGSLVPIRSFSDNNPSLWETEVNGTRVISPERAASLFGRDAVFVISIWSAARTSKVLSAQRQLEELGCEHVTTFVPLFRAFPDLFLPYFSLDRPEKVVDSADEVLATFDLLADRASQEEYLRQVEWRLTGDFACLAPPVEGRQYFPSDFPWPLEGDLFVDCGAFDGDTIRQLVEEPDRGFSRIVALEPDPRNYKLLDEYVHSLPEAIGARIRTFPAAVADSESQVRFRVTGTGASAADPAGEWTVRGLALDSILPPKGEMLLKFDVEGAEPEGILGARRVIAEAGPRLAVSVYHRQEHLWQIPGLLAGLRPQYELRLRAHNADSFDLVCYAMDPGAGSTGSGRVSSFPLPDVRRFSLDSETRDSEVAPAPERGLPSIRDDEGGMS